MENDKIKKIFVCNLARIYEVSNYVSDMERFYEVVTIYCKEGTCYVGEEKIECGEVYQITRSKIRIRSEGARIIVIFWEVEPFRRCLDEFRIYPKMKRKLINQDAIILLVGKLLTECEGDEWNKNFKIVAILYQLMYEITKRNAEETPLYEGLQDMETYQKMREVMDYISEHYSENLSLQQLAERYHYSEASMSRFFSKNFGTSFSEYYKDLRLNRAKQELLYSEKSISEIAIRNGFSSLRSFQRMFLGKNNMTPSEYRKNARKKKTAKEKND